MRAHRLFPATLVLAASTLLAGPALGAFHFMSIVEVFPGTAASPNAQYVVLQMYSAGQNQVQGHSIRVFNAAGTQIGTFTFGAAVGSGANQAKILIATTEAASFFNVSANLTMTAIIPLAGGKVCFDTIDCVAWGNYTGSSTGVGTPFNATGGGLRQGQAIKRNLGGNGTLESTDDTNISANDFAFGTPAPRNNAGSNGTIPPSTCGDGALAGLEACDDANTTSGDGCRGDCKGNEDCGDQLVDVGETCDDGNTVGNDACAANCGVAVCGNGIPEGAEECDDGNQDDLDACGNDCLDNFCGDGEANAGEECDDANQDDLDACGNDCQDNFCGDGEVNDGEQCDDGNQDDLDACGNDCLVNFCGDGEVNDGEACDDANQDDLDACGNDCLDNFCGDGEVNDGEECDDANQDDLDACGNDCLDNFCGDGEVNLGELCDDGNPDDLDDCGNDCQDNFCGDGEVNGSEECDDGNTTGGDGCPADCGAVPRVGEASPQADLRAERGDGSAVAVTFTPACGATDHAVYWGRGPIVGALEWIDAACALGVGGAGSFDPGVLLPDEWIYFVVVGHHDDAEGSYGRDSALTIRPEAIGVGACDRPLDPVGTCSR